MKSKKDNNKTVSNSKTKQDSKAKKSIIDTYSTIYYVDIVVANKYATLEELKELYVYSDGVELNDEILCGDATTSTCYRKSDNKAVVLIKYNGKPNVKGLDAILTLINTVCHEAGHATINIYRHMNQDICPCSSEPFCYLLGYIAECIYKTLKKR